MKRALFIICVFLSMLFENVYSQTLKVELSPDKSKVDRSVSNGTATIFFDSNVDDLSIVCTDENPDEPIQKIGEKLWFMHVDAKKDIDEEGICYRNFLLKSPSSAEYYLSTPEIGYNQVLYYTVVLPDKFPVRLSAEYLFTASAYHGVRLSYGGRYGFYLGYKWGNYFKYGQMIDDVAEDVKAGSFYTTPNGFNTSFSFFREDIQGYHAAYKLKEINLEVVCFFSQILSYFCLLVAAFKPCHGKLPLKKYMKT